MADYNKGDFTEQGINGTVKALVRLNNKRILDLSVATAGDNEAINNLDINIHDDVNGLSYNISGPVNTGSNPLGGIVPELFIESDVTTSTYNSSYHMNVGTFGNNVTAPADYQTDPILFLVECINKDTSADKSFAGIGRKASPAPPETGLYVNGHFNAERDLSYNVYNAFFAIKQSSKKCELAFYGTAADVQTYHVKVYMIRIKDIIGG